MQSVESVLSASQKEVDEVLKQNLSAKDLSVMVGTLRRELHANEIRKHELRKQLQSFKNDLRMEQEEKRKLQEKLSFYESENHTLKNRMRKIDEEPVDLTDTPELKKPRLALLKIDDQNTPSPLSRSDFEGRIKQIEESQSPYLKVKASSIGLAMLKKPLAVKDKQSLPKSLSIFQKPRVNFDNVKKSDNLVFNGVGGTSKVLQSDLVLKPPTLSLKKPLKRNLSASALGK
jgi:chromosome segregation ATPase